MKKISICIPCYNEEENIDVMYNVLTEQMKSYRGKYDYEILFEDNASQDTSKDILRSIAQRDKHVKVIFNTRNFGAAPSSWNCAFRASGDVIVSLPCDFQAPPEQLKEYLGWWEKGSLIVCGQKVKSQESKIKYFLRGIYYKIIKAFSAVPEYEQLIGIVVLDRKIVDALKEIYEPDDDFRHLIALLGYKVKLIPYEQQQRRAGKSSYNIYRYFDFAITSLINTSYLPLRLSVIFGLIMSVICFAIGVFYLVYKLVFWYTFDAGMAPLVIGIFFIGAVQLFFIGILGEYIGTILRKISKHPLVVEDELINFDNE